MVPVIRILAILIILIKLCCWAQVQLPFSGRSFSLKTAQILNLDNKLTLPKWTESYSFDQKRARINNNFEEEFFFDSKSNKSLIWSNSSKLGGEGGCSESSVEQLYRQIFPSLYSDQAFPQKIMKFLTELSPLPDQQHQHVVGPARLLFLLAKNFNKLELKSNNSSARSNERAAEYSLVLQPATATATAYSDSLMMIIFFKQEDVIGESQDFLRVQIMPLPIQINVKFYLTGLAYSTTIQYYNYELLMEELISQTDKTRMDLFAFPVLSNCSDLLNEVTKDTMNLLLGRNQERVDLERIKFSLTIQSEEQYLSDPRSYRHFLAYDGAIRMMRLEKRAYNNNSMLVKRSDKIPLGDIELINFNSNRRYAIRPRKEKKMDVPISSSSSCQQSRFQLLQMQNNSDYNCSVLINNLKLITHEGRKEDDLIELSNFLFGAEKFSYMGLAQVQGLRARVYESSSDHLPYWLNELTSLAKANSMAANQSSLPFKVIVFLEFTKNLKEFSRPLLLEVYNKIENTQDNMTSTLYQREASLVGRFNNFQLNLPNESLLNQKLFEVQEFCSESSSNDHVDVELELMIDEENQSTNELIENSQLRDEIIISKIVKDKFNIQRDMMYNFNSRFIKKSKSMNSLISTNFKIANSSSKYHIHNVTLVADNVQIIGDRLQTLNDNKISITSTESIMDCLHLIKDEGISEKVTTTFIYFNESKVDDSFCFVVEDLKHSADDDKSTTTLNSKVVTYSTHGTGKLFKIEKILNTRNHELLLNDTHQFENKTINLDKLDNSGEEFALRIKRFTIRNHITKSNVVVGEQPTATNKYSGWKYSLINNNSTTSIKIEKESTNAAYQCQAACLFDLNCNSYSFCVNSSPQLQFECILSEFDIKSLDDNIRKKFVDDDDDDDNHSILTKTSSRRRNKIQVDKNIELIRDNGCELLGKSYMNLFVSSDRLKTTLKGHQIFAIENKEKCAKMCFERSLIAIKAGVLFNEEAKNLILSKRNDFGSKHLQRELFEKLHKEYRLILLGFCRNFLYSSSTSKQEQDRLDLLLSLGKQRTTKNQVNIEPRSYCVLEGESNSFELDKELFDFYLYKFDFSHLYEKQYGIRLLESPMNREEFQALQVLMNKQTLKLENSTQYETILKQSINEGKNFQQIHLNTDFVNCAHLCFTQNSGAWYSKCRSFDVGIDSLNNSVCYINTIALKQAVRNDLIISNNNFKKSTQIWHYEPRFNFGLDESFDSMIFQEGANLIENFIIAHTFEIILTISLLSGLIIGFIIGNKINNNLDGRRNGGANTRNNESRNMDCYIMSPVNNQQQQNNGIPYISNPISLDNRELAFSVNNQINNNHINDDWCDSQYSTSPFSTITNHQFLTN